MKNPNLQIIQARLEPDWLEAVRLLRLYQREVEIDLKIPAFPLEIFERYLQELPKEFSSPRGRFFIAVDGEGRGIGCIGCHALQAGIAEIKRMFVLADFRGQGVGRALLSRAIESVEKDGFARVRLDTHPSMKAALHLYQDFGFQKIARYNDHPLPEIVFMERVFSRGWSLRLAGEKDIAALDALIPLSARALQAPYYSTDQLDASIGSVFGVDTQLIEDGTYYVVEARNEIVACGGWSRRKTLFGTNPVGSRNQAELDPRRESARVRAFFVHPAFARQGIGRRLLNECESAIRKAGFKSIELVATLAGEPFYLAAGFLEVRRYEIPLGKSLNLPVVSMKKTL